MQLRCTIQSQMIEAIDYCKLWIIEIIARYVLVTEVHRLCTVATDNEVCIGNVLNKNKTI